MKKLIILGMTLLLLVACGAEENTDPTNKPIDNPTVETGNEVDPNTETLEAPLIEEDKKGTTITFLDVPENEEELLQLVDFTNPKLTTALLLVSLRVYIDDPEEGIEMLNVLHGPEPLSDYDIDFIEERFSDKPYLPNSYFNGSSVENDYTPEEPLSVSLYDDELAPIEGYLRIFVYSSGAENIRYLQLREKKGEYFIWEFPGIMVGIKTPASMDPWA